MKPGEELIVGLPFLVFFGVPFSLLYLVSARRQINLWPTYFCVYYKKREQIFFPPQLGWEFPSFVPFNGFLSAALILFKAAGLQARNCLFWHNSEGRGELNFCSWRKGNSLPKKGLQKEATADVSSYTSLTHFTPLINYQKVFLFLLELTSLPLWH